MACSVMVAAWGSDGFCGIKGGAYGGVFCVSNALGIVVSTF